ncbi:MAG: AAA family ATPase [Shewanella sp.]|nr:AAA family ATPase [Shewanella sp.]MCF1458260.1 AAA family ATPase [Shewanella sp.]
MNQSIILVLGPSGIGKTTVIKQLAQKVNVLQVLTLDNITHALAREMGLITHRDNLNALIAALENDRERLLNFGIDAINHYLMKNQGKTVIIDVGTGFLDAPSSLSWISSYPSIAVMAEPASAFDRFRKARQLDISYEQYVSTQFSKSRCDIYNKAGIVLKTEGLSEAETAHRFACCVMATLPANIAHQALQQWLSE